MLKGKMFRLGAEQRVCGPGNVMVIPGGSVSTRSVGLLIDTVVCLTLAKWETVSFGGYSQVQRPPFRSIGTIKPLVFHEH
jgi:hypothetical protein